MQDLDRLDAFHGILLSSSHQLYQYGLYLSHLPWEHWLINQTPKVSLEPKKTSALRETHGKAGPAGNRRAPHIHIETAP